MRIILGFLILITAPLTYALSVDAALITQLQGEIELDSNKGSKRPAVAFMKLLEGEKLLLKNSSKAQLVFFKSGRHETWSGAGEVNIDASEGKSTSLKPLVKQLPSLLVKQLAKTPGAGQHARAGMETMRAFPTSASVERLERQYAEFKNDIHIDVLMPEIFYLNGLIELKEGDLANIALLKLRARQQEPGMQSLVEYFTPLAAALKKQKKEAQ